MQSILCGCMDVGALVFTFYKKESFMCFDVTWLRHPYLHFTPFPGFPRLPRFAFVSTSPQLLTFVICYLHFSLSLSFCFLRTSLPHVILSHSCACHHILKIEGHAISYIISMLLENQQQADALGRCRSTFL